MKKFRSKWFRVATAGATSDGRKIEPTWIQEMAASYSPTLYGARIWMEHIRGTLADSPFRAYGDVTAVKAEEVEVDGELRWALFAQIEPTPDLISMTKAKQKIYTSVEIAEKFADTGRAYLIGLGVTDSPASLGTEVLSFAAQHPESNPYSARKQHPDNLFTAAIEVTLEFEEYEPKLSAGAALFAKVRELIKGKDAQVDAEFAQVGEAVTALAEHVQGQGELLAGEQTKVAELATQYQRLSADLRELKQTLSTTADPHQTQRPPATGGRGEQLTDC